MDSEYRIPDPKVNPVACLTLAYKVTKQIPYDLRSWDKVHWARSSKASKQLLDICGDIRVADACLVELARDWDASGISWTLETVVKHAHDWISKRGKQNGNVHRDRFFKALRNGTGGGTDNPLRSAAEALPATFGSLQDAQETDQEGSKTGG